MSYSVKGGKLTRNFPKLGEKIVIETGQDDHGNWWWREATRDDQTPHGPFRTKREAEKDSEVTVLGPQCKFSEGGAWDSAWDGTQ
jgi:hypothetical protein